MTLLSVGQRVNIHTFKNCMLVYANILGIWLRGNNLVREPMA